MESTTAISGFALSSVARIALELDLGEQFELAGSSASRLARKRDLLHRLLAAYVYSLARSAHRGEHLQHQGRLAHARIPASSATSPATKPPRDPVELFYPAPMRGDSRALTSESRLSSELFATPANRCLDTASATLRPACSTRRSAGTGLATSATRRRTRCKRRRF